VSSEVPPAKVVKIDEWKVEAIPSYAPSREGRLEREGDSVFSAEINEVLIRKDNKRLNQLFGQKQPFKVEWTFNATNLITGAAVPVEVGKGTASDKVILEKVINSLGNTDVKVNFPNQDAHAVFEIVASANMTDSNGNTGTVQRRFSSHYIALTPETSDDELLSLIASVTGMPAEPLLNASKIDGLDENETSPRAITSRRARMLRLLVMRAAADQVITLDELRDLIKSAKFFRSP
jgi:hypothetical protein